MTKNKIFSFTLTSCKSAASIENNVAPEGCLNPAFRGNIVFYRGVPFKRKYKQNDSSFWNPVPLWMP